MNDEPTAAPLRDSGMCFACGERNPIGLRLSFRWDGDNYMTRFVPGENHQGWAERVHGGLIALVMDEVLARAALERHGLEWVTVDLSVRLLRPARIAVPLLFTGRIGEAHRRLIVCAGEAIEEETGTVVATGKAKLMRATHPSE
jgi:acyl-coenzyme A thioesterase PaaI-like protein